MTTTAKATAAPSPGSVLQLAAHDLACYAMTMNAGFEMPQHIELVIDKLEQVERGECRRLILCMPPRHGKSWLGAQIFPPFYLGRHPERSVVVATYGQDLSDDHGRKVRNTLLDALQRAIFPGCVLAGDSQNQRRFDLIAGGSFYAVGRGGPLGGRGASLLIVDDITKDREESRSDLIRRSTWDWFTHVARTRLTPNGAIVVLGTRWHEDDLVGRLLRDHSAEGWHVLSLAAIAEEDESFRPAGGALWPERFPFEVLDSIRSAIGGAAWQSLYQQRPAGAEGTVFKRQWFRSYREAPGSFLRIVQSWDTAFKTGADNDYSVCTTWGVAENGYYLLALWRDRVDFPALKRQLANQADQWTPSAILIEDCASGQSLIQELKNATRYPVLPVRPDRDKRTRAEAVTPLFESGRVFVPEAAPFVEDLLDELATFPDGAHDDAVDSLTQGLNWCRSRNARTVTISQVLI